MTTTRPVICILCVCILVKIYVVVYVWNKSTTKDSLSRKWARSQIHYNWQIHWPKISINPNHVAGKKFFWHWWRSVRVCGSIVFPALERSVVNRGRVNDADIWVEKKWGGGQLSVDIACPWTVGGRCRWTLSIVGGHWIWLESVVPWTAGYSCVQWSKRSKSWLQISCKIKMIVFSALQLVDEFNSLIAMRTFESS